MFINKRPTSAILRVPFTSKLVKALAFGLSAASPGSIEHATYSPLSHFKTDTETATFTAPPERALLRGLTLKP